MQRPLTRLRLVLPVSRSGGADAHDGRTPAPVEALAQRIADALAVHGVQVRQQVRGALFDGAPRADVALWLPDVGGAVSAPDPRVAPARVHAALVVEGSLSSSSAKAIARFDVALVPHEALREPLRAALRKHGARDIPVVVAKLPGTPALAREAEKALRGVAGRRVVLVDVRGDFESDIERVVVQLALSSREAALVLLAPHDERSRARVRTLCDRHNVDAWLASGGDSYAQSIAAVDLFVGAPSWDELLLAALVRTPVALLPFADGAPHQLADVLLSGRTVDDVMGTLQLAAAVDRRLADPGALEAKGIALREALFGSDKDFLDALAGLEPLPQGALQASLWEPVGPHAEKAQSGAPVVDARDAEAPAEPSRGQKIDDALEALKARIGKAP